MHPIGPKPNKFAIKPLLGMGLGLVGLAFFALKSPALYSAETIQVEDLPAKDLQLKITYHAKNQKLTLRSWDPERLRQLNLQRRLERDPMTQAEVSWSGFSLQDMLEKSLEELDLHQRSLVDLIVFKSRLGQHGFLPRSFTHKFPLLMATQRNGQHLGPRGPFYSVVAWTRPDKRLQDEVLPIQKYFVSGIEEVILTNYKDYYQAEIFVNRRTDPLVIRGEKRFVQTCMGCHSLQRLPSVNELANKVLSAGLLEVLHSNVKGVPPMLGIEEMAIKSYLRELQQSDPSLSLTTSR